MVQKVITAVVCDMCIQEDQGEKEVQFRGEVTVGPISRWVDLCADHKEKLIGGLDEALQGLGTTIRKTNAKMLPLDTAVQTRRRSVHDEQAHCPLPDCGKGPYRRLAMHYKQAHKMSVAEVEAAVAAAS